MWSDEKVGLMFGQKWEVAYLFYVFRLSNYQSSEVMKKAVDQLELWINNVQNIIKSPPNPCDLVALNERSVTLQVS